MTIAITSGEAAMAVTETKATTTAMACKLVLTLSYILSPLNKFHPPNPLAPAEPASTRRTTRQNPPQPVTRTRPNPYPWSGVWVLAGTGTGSLRVTRGLPVVIPSVYCTRASIEVKRGVRQRRRMVTRKKENGDKESNRLKERGQRGDMGGVDEAH
ncbi:hypothetical protein EDB84DRAFT_1447726 [Lactarius hengduanensis]|nr:hypothetical protein EDB84DRAFT_1447726 [Lactarius hengduanensis]